MHDSISSTDEAKRLGRLALAITSALVFLYLVFSTTSVIDAGKVGVVTRFGDTTGRELDSGLNFKLPWPVEAVWEADTRVQKEEQLATAASQDLQDVNAKVAVNYHIERGQVSEIYKNLGPKYKERIIDPAIQEVFKASTARFPVADLIVKRNEAKDLVRKQLEDRLHRHGIKVDDVSIVNFEFSPAFSVAIEQKQVAAQEAERAKFNLERARLDAESQRLQKETLSPELLQKWAIEKWDGKFPQFLGSGTVFNIPLQGGK